MAEQGLLGLPGGPLAPKKRRRRERDAYYSPDWAIDTFVERVPEARGGTLLDPCCEAVLGLARRGHARQGAASQGKHRPPEGDTTGGRQNDRAGQRDV